MTPSLGLSAVRVAVRPAAGALAALLLCILAPLLFMADMMAGPAIAFGLPNVALVMIAHRLTAGRATTLAAAVVSVMVVAAPVSLVWGTGGVIAVNEVLGRVVVLLATWLVAALLHERDTARLQMRSHEENFEERIQRRTGEMRQVNVQLHREINERRRAEHRSRYLASIVESCEDAIIGQSLDGVVVSWNTGATRVYGFDREEMIGQPAARLIPIERDAEMGEFLGHVARGQRVDPIETQRLRKDGVVIDVSVSVSPILDETGAIVGASLIERDISRRKQAEEALQSLNCDLEARVQDRTEELEAALEELESFNYSVSHDLRAPLRAVQGFGAALEEECGAQMSEEGLGLLQRMRVASARMDQIINDILMLSQASHNRLERETIDLSSLARDVADDLRVEQAGRRVEWHIDDEVEVWADPGLLRLVMQNLLGNAFKYSRDREVAVIEFGVEQSDEQGPVLFVRDNGAGFDPALASGLFEPFQRLHRADDFEGSGIGLATVAKILRRHGGRIWAEGKLGAGATFRFQLPSAPWLRRSAAA